MTEAMLAIYDDGIAHSVVVIEDADFYHEAIAEWSLRPDLREMVRVPVAVARRFIMEPWPGLQEAERIMAQAEGQR